MTDDLDKLVVAHLREIHAELQGISTKLAAHDRRFDDLNKRDRGWHDLQRASEHTLGLAPMNDIKVAKLEARHNAAEAWQRQITERLDGIERRLAKVEAKLGL